jgi:hypothetical protein
MDDSQTIDFSRTLIALETLLLLLQLSRSDWFEAKKHLDWWQETKLKSDYQTRFL